MHCRRAHSKKEGPQRASLHNPIDWKDFPTTTDFEGVAFISLFAERDDTKLDSEMVAVAKRGNELVFVGDPIDVVAVHRPDRSSEFPKMAFISALHQTSFASRYLRKDGSLKRGVNWEIQLFGPDKCGSTP